MSTVFKTFFSFKECHSFFKRKKRQKQLNVSKSNQMYVWQKDRHYRSMGEPGNKPIRLQSSDFQQRCQNHSMRKQQSFQQMMLRQLNSHIQKNEVWSLASHHIHIFQFSSVQSISRVRLFVTPWIAARQASLSITISRSSLKLTCIELVMPSSRLILCRPLFLLPPTPPHIILTIDKNKDLRVKTKTIKSLEDNIGVKPSWPWTWQKGFKNTSKANNKRKNI